MSDRHHGPERPAGAPSPPARSPASTSAMALSGPTTGAALAAGLAAAAGAQGRPIGLGIVVAGLLCGAAAWVARPSWADPWAPVWAGLACALLGVALLRDAGWVVVPSLLAALALASLALSGGRSGRRVAAGLAVVMGRFVPGTTALAAGVGRLVPGGARAAPVARGVGLALVLLATFGLLFASGDAAFAQIAGDTLPEVDDLGSLPSWLLWLGAGALVASALATIVPASEPERPPVRRRFGRVEWGIALASVNALFAVFVVVQAAVLFGRNDHVLGTAGLTYAEYAREGFAELMVAAALTLGVVAAALRWADASGRRERIALRALLVTLCAFTLVVLTSAAHRLDLYQDAFGATRLRLAAGCAIVWVAVVVGLTLGRAATGREGWLPRACVLASALIALSLALYDPDRRIAERNVDRLERTQRFDAEYASELSADAVPALARLPEPMRAQVLAGQRHRLRGGDGWGGLNLARRRARNVLARTGP